MNQDNSNEHDIHDQLINVVTTLKPAIKALQLLIGQADDAVATRLDQSLSRIDGTVDEISTVIEALGDSASITSETLNQYQNLVLEKLQAAVTAFTDDEMPRRYDDKIAGIITDMKQQIDTAVQAVVANKNESLEVQVSGMQTVADKLNTSADNLALFTSQYKDGHEQIVQDIEDFETATKTRIEQAEDRAGKGLDKTYQAIESMSIKRIVAAVAAGTAAVIISLVALVFWYVPSFADIAELKSQQAELERGIDELEIGWQQAFDNAQSQQFVFSCDVNKEKPNVISWCVRADSKYFVKDDKGFVYYQLSAGETEPTE